MSPAGQQPTAAINQYPALFDTVLNYAGIEVVLSGVQIPRMNAITERWVLT
jgi:putative transposase